MINVYDSKETDFTKNGLVILSDCISCQVTEELNGAFECNIEYPLDERGKWTYLLEGNIIKADGQLFRIFKKTKTLTTININSRHIYYDLIDNFLEDVRPTALTGTGALDWILTHTQYAHSFTSSGDVASSNTHYYVRKNVIESIMGSEGIISIWGGEIVRDNYNISLLQQRGADRGVLVQYAKNIEGIEETLDIDGITTRIMPVGKDGLLLPEKYVDSPYINNFSHPKIRPIPFNDITIEADLRAAAIAYYTSSKCDIPESNHKVDFIELSKTDQYKNYAVLERVFLGDIITIRHARLGIDLQDKIIKTTKDILTNRLIKIESGSFKDNLATSINTTVQEIKQDIIQVKSDYQKAIENATNLITGSEGGNVVIRCDDITGKPYEILIMDTTDVMTCMKCWRWNLGGLGYSSSGIEGPFEVAITMDGSIVGKFITALTISGGQIIGGTITGVNIKTSNTVNYLLLHDQFIDFYNGATKVGTMGYVADLRYGGSYDFGLKGDSCSFTAYAGSGGFDMRSTGWNYFWGNCDFRGQITMAGDDVAGHNWTATNFVQGWQLADFNYLKPVGNIVNLPNGCYLECLTDRLILHANLTNYISIGSGTMIVVENGASRPV